MPIGHHLTRKLPLGWNAMWVIWDSGLWPQRITLCTPRPCPASLTSLHHVNFCLHGDVTTLPPMQERTIANWFACCLKALYHCYLRTMIVRMKRPHHTVASAPLLAAKYASSLSHAMQPICNNDNETLIMRQDAICYQHQEGAEQRRPSPLYHCNQM